MSLPTKEDPMDQREKELMVMVMAAALPPWVLLVILIVNSLF
jgi:hypothetical protein